MSQCASFLFLNGRFESSSFPAERFTASNKYEFALKNKVISTRDNDHVSVTEPVEVNGNAFHIFNSQALRQKVPFGTSDSPTAIKKHKFSRQDNISCEFYEVKLGSKPQGLRHKVLSEVSDGFAATDKALSEVSNGFTATNRAMSEASDALPATDKVLSEVSDGLPATDRVLSEVSDGLPATDRVLSEVSDVFTATNRAMSEASDGLPAIDGTLSEVSDVFTSNQQRPIRAL